MGPCPTAGCRNQTAKDVALAGTDKEGSIDVQSVRNINVDLEVNSGLCLRAMFTIKSGLKQNLNLNKWQQLQRLALCLKNSQNHIHPFLCLEINLLSFSHRVQYIIPHS